MAGYVTAVEAEKWRSEICFPDGLILVPKQVVDRPGSDDRIAAVLADGIEYDMQRQSARIVGEWRKALGVEAAALLITLASPPLGLALLAGDIVPLPQTDQYQEERGRIALALMQDAGFDLRQAPEAWRLLAPKQLPADLSSLPYPDRIGYQLGILYRQYRQFAEPSGTVGPSSRTLSTTP